jgi:hypothetical protein
MEILYSSVSQPLDAKRTGKQFSGKIPRTRQNTAGEIGQKRTPRQQGPPSGINRTLSPSEQDSSFSSRFKTYAKVRSRRLRCSSQRNESVTMACRSRIAVAEKGVPLNVWRPRPPNQDRQADWGQAPTGSVAQQPDPPSPRPLAPSVRGHSHNSTHG